MTKEILPTEAIEIFKELISVIDNPDYQNTDNLERFKKCAKQAKKFMSENKTIIDVMVNGKIITVQSI